MSIAPRTRFVASSNQKLCSPDSASRLCQRLQTLVAVAAAIGAVSCQDAVAVGGSHATAELHSGRRACQRHLQTIMIIMRHHGQLEFETADTSTAHGVQCSTTGLANPIRASHTLHDFYVALRAAACNFKTWQTTATASQTSGTALSAVPHESWGSPRELEKP
jgi:hypothetical protein